MDQKNKFWKYVPLIAFFVLHLLASYTSSVHTFSIAAMIGALIISFLAFIWGEGYAVLGFMIAKAKNSTVMYILTILLSFVSMMACVAGCLITGIEGYECVWMTVCLIILNIGILIASIVNLIKKFRTEK